VLNRLYIDVLLTLAAQDFRMSVVAAFDFALSYSYFRSDIAVEES